MEQTYNKEYPILNMKDEREYIRMAQSGDKVALDYLILSNMGLIKKLAGDFWNRGISKEDLCQVGVMGFMKGITKYDMSKTVKLTTYCYWWIRQAIVYEIQSKSRMIRIPATLYQKNFNLVLKTAMLEKDLGYYPSVKELADYCKITEKEVNKFRQLMTDVVSVDDVLNKEGYTDVSFETEDKECNLCAGVISTIFTDELLNLVKDILTEKQYKVFIMHVGLGCSPMTFDEIAATMDLTRQRIQQIYVKSLKKLQCNYRVKEYDVRGDYEI